MRASRALAVGVVMVGIFACWFMTVQAGPSAWPANKGEFCLRNTNNDEMVRVAVMRTVGNNYTVQGFATESSGGKSLFNGNAIVEGDSVLMHVSSSGYMEAEHHTWGSVGTVELNANTLYGRVIGINFHCDVDTALCAVDYDGIQGLEPMACP